MPEDNSNITHFFADLLKQDDDFQLLNSLDEDEIYTLTTAYNEAIKHPVLYGHDKEK